MNTTHCVRVLAVGPAATLLSCFLLNAAPLIAQTATLTIRTAVVLEDLSVRAIPQVDLRLIGPMGDTVRIETDLDGKASLLLAPGEWRVESVAPVTIGSTRLVWHLPVSVASSGSKVELTARNATTPEGGAVQLALVPRSGRRVSEEAEVFERVKSGVFTVWGEEGKGSGFLADSAGVVLTNAHVVAGSSEVRVQINDSTKVRARILHIDKDRDVAALQIPMSRCARCAVLALATAANRSIAVVGERVLAIGSPLNQTGVMTIGIVSKVEERAVISDVNINHGNSGGPMLNDAGEVIAINAFGDFTDEGGPGISGSILITQAEPVLLAARSKLTEGAAPSDSLLPNAPRVAFPLDAIKAVAAQKRFDLRPYAGDAPGFDYVLLTPPAMAWRQAQTENALLQRRKQREQKAEVSENQRVDPIQNWPSWMEYLGQRKAVIAFYVMPKIAETKASGWANFLGALSAGISGTDFQANYDLEFKGDFQQMKLMRDGVEIIPVDRNRSPAVLDVLTWTAQGKDYAYQGIYVYRPEEFAPRPDGTFATYTVEIQDTRKPGRPIQFTLSPKTVKSLWRDFAPYREALSASSDGSQ